MRLLRTVVLALALGGGSAYAAGSPPVVDIAPVASAPPIIDGDLSDVGWARAPQLGDWSVIDGWSRAVAGTVAQLLADEERLYIGAMAHIPGGAEDTTADRPDRIEIRAASCHSEEWFYSFTIDETGSTGVGLHRRQPSGPWSQSEPRPGIPWQAAAARSASSWCAEFAIPLASIVEASDGAPTSLVLNIVRHEPRLGEVSAWACPRQTPVGSELDKPSRFARIVLRKADTGLREPTAIDWLASAARVAVERDTQWLREVEAAYANGQSTSLWRIASGFSALAVEAAPPPGVSSPVPSQGPVSATVRTDRDTRMSFGLRNLDDQQALCVRIFPYDLVAAATGEPVTWHNHIEVDSGEGVRPGHGPLGSPWTVDLPPKAERTLTVRLRADGMTPGGYRGRLRLVPATRAGRRYLDLNLTVTAPSRGAIGPVWYAMPGWIVGMICGLVLMGVVQRVRSRRQFAHDQGSVAQYEREIAALRQAQEQQKCGSRSVRTRLDDATAKNSELEDIRVALQRELAATKTSLAKRERERDDARRDARSAQGDLDRITAQYEALMARWQEIPQGEKGAVEQLRAERERCQDLEDTLAREREAREMAEERVLKSAGVLNHALESRRDERRRRWQVEAELAATHNTVAVLRRRHDGLEKERHEATERMDLAERRERDVRSQLAVAEQELDTLGGEVEGLRARTEEADRRCTEAEEQVTMYKAGLERIRDGLLLVDDLNTTIQAGQVDMTARWEASPGVGGIVSALINYCLLRLTEAVAWGNDEPRDLMLMNLRAIADRLAGVHNIPAFERVRHVVQAWPGVIHFVGGPPPRAEYPSPNQSLFQTWLIRLRESQDSGWPPLYYELDEDGRAQAAV